MRDPRTETPAPSIAFDTLVPVDVTSAMVAHVAEAERTARDFFAGPPSVASLIGFLDGVMEHLDATVLLAEHMDEMTGTAAWSEAHELVTLQRDRFRSWLYASEALAERLASAGLGPSLGSGETRILSAARRTARRGGTALPAETRARVDALDALLVEKTAAYTRQLDGASRAFTLDLDEPSRLRGLPSWCVELARAAADAHGLPGFRLTLQMPVVEAVLTYADDRELRRSIYLAHNTRATVATVPGDGRHGDNRVLVDEIVALRAERAALVGYASFADMALDGRMMASAAAARAFLVDLGEKVGEVFAAETESLAEAARAAGCPELEPWDVAYYAEHQRRAVCAFDAEDVRPYLPFAHVLEAVQGLTRQLFGVRWQTEDLPTWHPSVTTWSIWSGDERLSVVYLDPFTRDGKREGAWMSSLVPCIPGRGAGALVIATNIAPATTSAAHPCVGLEDVARLLHEMGHAMHHVLSRSRWVTLSGTCVAWDFVELPSTLLERLLWTPEVLARMFAHVEGGEPLPAQLLEQCLSAHRFRTASALMPRIGLALVDLELHTVPTGNAVRTARAIMQRFSPARLPESYARVASLSHVFGSTQGYEASLYTYVWADVLAADGVVILGSTWERLAASGRRLRDVLLARGGEEDATRLAEEFLGHAPSPQALLEQCLGRG